MLLLLLSLTACTNSGLGRTTPSGSTGDTGVVGTADPCPWIGTWTLTDVGCAAFGFDEWFIDHDGAMITFTQNDAIGGCNATLDIAGAGCIESEEMHFSAPIGIEVTVTYSGISACSPTGCTFGAVDEPCEEGDRSQPPQSRVIDDSTGDLQMVDAVRLNVDPADCPLEINTTWTPAR